jgi:hypothetical protein
MWGQATTQIFTSVSPDMHYEFALQYETRVLNNFGLNCYGCCEPLHLKMDYVRRIPRLRRVSMSPWVDLDIAAANIGDKYIFSNKPNPAIIVQDPFDETVIRRDITERCEKARGCVLEIIMKDVHTAKNDITRLTRWTRIAREVAEKYV